MRHIHFKALQSLLICFVLLAGTLFMSCKSTQTVAQKEQQALRVKQMLESSDFTFNAEFAYPLADRPRPLTAVYSLKVSKDSIKAYLPFFGRAYVAPIGSSENGIKFSNTEFKYNIVKGKKPGNWIVTIKTKMYNRSLDLTLDAWENGTASLTVNDPDRQSISFAGKIAEKE